MANTIAAPSNIRLKQKSVFNPIILGPNQKAGVGVGVEFDENKLRCAMVSCNSKAEVHIEALEQREGDFSRPEVLIQSLKSCRDFLPGNENETWSSCVHGEDVFVSQVEIAPTPNRFLFKKIKEEAAKKTSLDLERAVLDYQEIPALGSKSNFKNYIVAAVDKNIISRHTNILQRSGISQFKLDILPLSLANALYLGHPETKAEDTHVIIHFGSEYGTVIMEGANIPFDSYRFKLEQMMTELPRLMEPLYKKGHFKTDRPLWLSGGKQPDIDAAFPLQSIFKRPVTPINLVNCCGYTTNTEALEFDLALSLAIRGLE